MALYAITWQLNSLQPHPEEQEARIIEKIKTLEHFNDPDLKHVWFVSTSWSKQRLHRYLYKQFEAPDRFLIEESDGPFPVNTAFTQWTEKMKLVSSRRDEKLDKEERKGEPKINQDKTVNWRARIVK